MENVCNPVCSMGVIFYRRKIKVNFGLFATQLAAIVCMLLNEESKQFEFTFYVRMNGGSRGWRVDGERFSFYEWTWRNANTTLKQAIMLKALSEHF